MLLDTALDPVLDEAAQQADDPRKRCWASRSCDPACGSGHFLVAAARRIARRLAAIRTGDEEPPPEAVSSAMRDGGRAAASTASTSTRWPPNWPRCRLWLEALRPGKPLTFLDAHIKVGNSLLGATPGAA